MKRFLFSLCLLITVYVLHGQTSGLLVNENFTGFANGDLNTVSGGQGSWRASFNNGSADFIQVANSSPLMYPDYTCGSQYINVKQKKDYLLESGKYPDDPSTDFSKGIVAIHDDNTSFYISFLVRVSSATGVKTTGDARPNIALRTLNGGVFADFYIGLSGNGRQLKFGINKDENEDGIFSPSAYNFNTTYLIVIRYDVGNGKASADYDDQMYLWVNPSLAAEPSPNAAAVAIDNLQDYKFDGGMDAPASALQLFQEGNSATASFDAFKVAYAQGYGLFSANSAAAWNALSPAGTPLPVTFSAFKGYTEENKVKLDWQVDFEFNVLRYEVERSGNGVSFSSVADIGATNKGLEALYTWTDKMPQAGNNYYRIKNIYKTGDAVYSSIVRVSLKNQAASFEVYPNPALHDNVSVQLNSLPPGDYTFELINTEGQRLSRQTFNHAGGNCIREMKLSKIKTIGIFTIQLTGKDFKEAKRIIIE